MRYSLLLITLIFSLSAAMGTAKLGSIFPLFKNLRTLLYDAVSTSIEKVEVTAVTSLNFTERTSSR